MPSVVISPTPILQFLLNTGAPAAGGSVLTQVGGVNAATYSDSAGTILLPNPIPLNSRGEVSTSAGASAQLFLPANTVYTFTLFDNLGNQIWVAPYCNGVQFILTAGAVGAVLYPQTAAEAAVLVVPVNLQYPPGSPERYVATFTYATNTAGAGGTDFAPAINTALSVVGQPCLLGPNYYAIFSTLLMPAASSIIGAGMWASNLCCVAGTWTSAHVITDTGNAAKVVIKNLGIYGNNIAADGINLGNNAVVFGTAGYIDQVYITNVTGLALNVKSNVADMGTIYCNVVAGVQVLGSGTHIDNLSVVGGTGSLDNNSNLTSCYLGDVHVTDLEIEGPNTNVIFLTANGATRIDAFWPSLLANASYTELIYITSNAANWRVNIPAIYFSGPTFGTYQNVGYDQATATFFGAGSPSSVTTTQAGIGDYGFGSFVTGHMLAVKKQQLNAFTLRVTNVSATLNHAISAVGQFGVASSFSTSFNLTTPSQALTPTPTGSDSGTAFAAGGKIGSATPSMFIFDTNAETAADACFIATISANNTGTAYQIVATQTNINVNGQTLQRLTLQLLNPTSAAAVSWSTALASNGNLIDTTVFGFWR